MLQHTQFKMSAARNRSEKEKQPPQNRRNRSYDRNADESEQNIKEQYVSSSN